MAFIGGLLFTVSGVKKSMKVKCHESQVHPEYEWIVPGVEYEVIGISDAGLAIIQMEDGIELWVAFRGCGSERCAHLKTGVWELVE